MDNQKPFFRIIDEICEEKNIEQEKVSYGWIRMLYKDGVTHGIVRNQLSINSAVSFIIAEDKYATYEVLDFNNIPVILHKMIFSPITRSKYHETKYLYMAINFWEQNNRKIVIKANNSCEGKDVYVCYTEKEIKDTIEKLFKENNDSVSICPYLDIDYEYRAIYLCGEIIYVYKKKKAFVIGDGTSNLSDLIKTITEERYVEMSKDLDLNYIPKLNEEVDISWKHNLCNGAIPIIIDDTDTYINEVKDVAVRAGTAIGIEFASVDIAVTKDNKVLVMEINKNVCMNKFTELVPNGYEIAKGVYSKVIDKMFNMS